MALSTLTTRSFGGGGVIFLESSVTNADNSGVDFVAEYLGSECYSRVLKVF